MNIHFIDLEILSNSFRGKIEERQTFEKLAQRRREWIWEGGL